jgi:hypothetical protein
MELERKPLAYKPSKVVSEVVEVELVVYIDSKQPEVLNNTTANSRFTYIVAICFCVP